MTRLYYTDAFLRRFNARVIDAGADGRHLCLDRTAFYPTSGGQPFDTGTLNGIPVEDVIDDADGRIVHVVQSPLLAGDEVAGEIDWSRRADHMQQHTGQHILSAAFEQVTGARTESFRLGTAASTIDLAREVTNGEVAASEAAANRIVWDNRPVSIRFVSEEEATRLPLRKESRRSGFLRLIEIEGCDLSACGGTHVSRTGEVGTIAVRGTEKFRGGTRVEFVCGARMLESYQRLREVAGHAARLFSVTASDVPAAIERHQDEAKDLRRSLKRLMERTVRFDAAALATSAADVRGVLVAVQVFDDYDAGALKQMAATYVTQPGRAAVLFTGGTAVQVVAMRSSDVGWMDCGALIGALCSQFGGKGGGRPDAAQGGGLQGSAEVLLAAARRVTLGAA